VSAADPDAFYGDRVPAHWNRTVDAQERAAEADPEARRLLDEMQRVRATIDVVVTGGPTPRRYHLNVRAGRMTADAEPVRPPFLVLVHDLDTFATLERESGDSVLGFLGALAGQAGDMKLTVTRLQNLLALSGSARLELTGGAPMTLVAHFGPETGQEAPECTLRIPSDTYAALRAGELAPQEAFLGGEVEIEGDMQLAMQLALAALAPE
jgi:hypothetical protein